MCLKAGNLHYREATRYSVDDSRYKKKSIHDFLKAFNEGARVNVTLPAVSRDPLLIATSLTFCAQASGCGGVVAVALSEPPSPHQKSEVLKISNESEIRRKCPQKLQNTRKMSKVPILLL